MAIKLRKKAPFFCRHMGPNGQLDCTSTPLTEADRDLCANHQHDNDAALQERVAHIHAKHERRQVSEPVSCGYVMSMFPDTPEYEFCGKAKEDGKTYCPEHQARLPYWPE